MGYELHFKYYKKKEDGFGYLTEGEPEILKVNVGKQWDEVDLDEVAKSVFGQMAKRNILIVDAEIYEYIKKKVSFKMKDDGISIKNRKFSYDISGSINSESDDPPVETNGHGLQPHELMNKQIVPVNEPEISRRAVSPSDRMIPILPPKGQPLRYEVYDPHPDLKRVAQQKKLPFTIGKRYPIFEEKADRRGLLYGMIYMTEDDVGNRCALNDKHFVPVQNLTNNFGSEARPNHISSVAVEENMVSVNGKAMNLPDIYTLGRRR